MKRVFILITLLAGMALGSTATAQPTPGAGAVAFENSGAPAAQAPFLRGLALLHNFEYPRAAAAFREAQAADPGFALAYWGEAMTHNHPVWMVQDAPAARAVLARLGASPAERAARARNDRERAYLAAVEALYGEGDKHARDRLYSDAMARLFARWPDDVDGRAFYALSLIGLAHQGRDYALYMRAAGLLEEVYPARTSHPGVLHYLIHAYDDPIHAPLGLRMARRYAAVAPDAPHAIHMTSHIFLALGMWDDVIAMNRAGVAAVNQLRRQDGRGPAHCGHYNEWLVYGLHQAGRAAEARAGLDACRGAAREAADGSLLVSWADMAAREAIETGARPVTEGIGLEGDPAVAARFTLAYADLLLAADAASAQASRNRLVELDRTLATRNELPQLPRRRAVILAQAEALAELRAGRAEAGLAALRRAAETERSLPAEFGPPLVEKPSFELLGDELLRLGRRAEAQEAYRAALALAPGRRLSLEGLRRTAG
jgi:tetratricopeptide (TPR) repeat protein